MLYIVIIKNWKLTYVKFIGLYNNYFKSYTNYYFWLINNIKTFTLPVNAFYSLNVLYVSLLLEYT